MNRQQGALRGKSVVLLMLLGISTIALAQNAVTVSIVNSQAGAIYVSFTTINQTPGTITWNSAGNGCLNTGTNANAAYTQINAGQTCTASVNTSSSSTRFCAAASSPPANCMNAQAQHLTMVETNFEAASNSGCFGKGACVWYDISVIPSTCTDALWQQNRCAKTGGASYNLPVTLSCAGNSSEPTYTCQGPTSRAHGPENYPSKCGNPNAKCATGTPNCSNGVSAYFYPMFDPPENAYQPNAVCLQGSLSINFLSGS